VREQFLPVWSSPGFAMAALVQGLLHIEGRNTGIDNLHSLLTQSVFVDMYTTHLGLSRADVFRFWNTWEGTREFVDFQTALERFGNHILWVPVLEILRCSLASRVWRGFDAAVTILARFVPPLDLALSVVDIAFASFGIVRTLIDRVRLFSSINAMRGRSVYDTPILSRYVRIRAPSAAIEDDSGLPNVPIVEETVFFGAFSLHRTQRIVGAGGLVVAIPVGVGLSLAAAGIVGGLTIAASPFLAGYEAYNRVRGTQGINWDGVRARLRTSVEPPEPVAQLRPSGVVLVVPGHIIDVAIGTTDVARQYQVMQPSSASNWDTGVSGFYRRDVGPDSDSSSDDDTNLPYDDFLTREI